MRLSCFLVLLTTFILPQAIGTFHPAFAQNNERSIEQQKVKFKESTIIRSPEEEDISNRKEEILDYAKNTTVYIQNTNNSNNFMSGVIIARKDTTYVVLTSRKQFKKDNSYVITVKGELQFSIVDIDPLPQTDLTIVTFESKKKFKVATLNSNTVQEGSPVYIAGYQLPGLNIKNPILSISEGSITNVYSEIEQSRNQIEINYPTSQGMGGGPIYNRNGQVIAINILIDDIDKSLGILSRQLKNHFDSSGKGKYIDFKFKFAKPESK